MISDPTGSAKAYDASKRLIGTFTPGRRDSTLSTGELAAAGFLSAFPTTLITAPVERAKVLLQVSYYGSENRHVILILYEGAGARGI